jgi:hypothetical protein
VTTLRLLKRVEAIGDGAAGCDLHGTPLSASNRLAFAAVPKNANLPRESGFCSGLSGVDVKRLFLVIALVFMTGPLLAPSAFAQQPPGSYRQSCGNIRFDGRQLSAVCADRYGRRVPTSLMVDNCDGGISNDNGQLTCEFGGGRRMQSRQFDDDDDYRPRRPRRDYDGGYRGGDYRGGGPRDDGFRGGGPQMPGGSWHASCKNGSMQGTVVVALCANARGQFQQTSADVRSCRSFANRNGNLACE